MICEGTEGHKTECLDNDSNRKCVQGKACRGHVFPERPNNTLNVVPAVDRPFVALYRGSSIFRWFSYAKSRFI